MLRNSGLEESVRRDSVHYMSRVSWDTLSIFPEQKVLRKNSPRPSERKSRDVTATKLNALKIRFRIKMDLSVLKSATW